MSEPDTYDEDEGSEEILILPCTVCYKANVILGEEEIESGETIVCPNRDCGANFDLVEGHLVLHKVAGS